MLTFPVLLAVAFASALAPGAVAQEQPNPAEVRGARFTTGSVNFTDGSVNLTDGSVNFTEGTVNFTTGNVSLITGTVAQPAQDTGGQLRFELTADLLFDFDKADLRPEAEAVLSDVAAQIKAKVKRPAIRVEGHTDAKGTDAYNQDLSQRRAASVKDWFVRTAKLPAKSITTAGHGETRPVAPNEKPDGSDDPEGRQKNRRVEIIVTAQR